MKSSFILPPGAPLLKKRREIKEESESESVIIKEEPQPTQSPIQTPDEEDDIIILESPKQEVTDLTGENEEADNNPLDALKKLNNHEIRQLCLFYKIYKKKFDSKEMALASLTNFLKDHPELLEE
jgi:hypothetical protein